MNFDHIRLSGLWKHLQNCFLLVSTFNFMYISTFTFCKDFLLNPHGRPPDGIKTQLPEKKIVMSSISIQHLSLKNTTITNIKRFHEYSQILYLYYYKLSVRVKCISNYIRP